MPKVTKQGTKRQGQSRGGRPAKSSPTKSPSNATSRGNSVSAKRADYVVNCREVMSIKFVTCAADLESADQFFSPVYVHQLFQNEKIIGYRDLEIRVFFSQPHLHCYIEIDYGEKLDELSTTDILGVFKKWIKAGFTTNKTEFLKRLKEPFRPIGHLQCTFIRPDADQNTEDMVTRRPRTLSKVTKTSRNTPRSHRIRRKRDPECESGNDGDNDSSNDSVESEAEVTTPRSDRLMKRRKRKLERSASNRSRKRRKLGNSVSENGSSVDGDAQNGSDCNHFVDAQSFVDKDNTIPISKFDLSDDDALYEIRIGSFADPAMREFHQRMQFFVLLYIESSSFLDTADEIWEVLILSRRCGTRRQTLGYLTLYKFYAYNSSDEVSKRLRISQVMIFPPFQRQSLGFEALQHVYRMAEYRNFIEVNVEDPGPAMKILRDSTDVYNAFIHQSFDRDAFRVCNLTTYHAAKLNGKQSVVKKEKEKEEVLSYSPNTVKRRRTNKGSTSRTPILFPFITQHKKLSKGVYHDAIMQCSKQLKITPEQARVAYECLKWEHIDREDDEQWKMYRLDVKRRLYAMLNMENLHNYDESGIFARITQEFNATTDRYAKILRKRDDWIRRRMEWEKTHQYPRWIEERLKQFGPTPSTPRRRPKTKRRRKKL